MNWKNGEYTPKQTRSGEKKNRILEAALALFSERGYHGTTAKAIAARADVATGSFYRYFRDKKAAFMAVCMYMEAAMGGSIFDFGRELRQKGRSERDILIEMIRFSVKAHHRNKAFHREILVMKIADPDVAAWTRAREDRVLANMMAFMEPTRDKYRVTDLAAATAMLYYAIEEVAHRAVIFDDPVGEDRLVQALQDMLLRYFFD